MLAIKIDNPEIENKFKQYALHHKKAIEDVVNEAIKMFLDANKKDNELIYVKKDPIKHLHQINYDEDDDEDLSDVKLYSHVKNSVKYIHDLRRNN